MEKQDIGQRYVLVVGAIGGMGHATCEALQKAGYAVLGIDRTLPASPLQDVTYYACDICEETSLKNVVADLEQKEIRLSAILHMAGLYILD